MGAFRLLTLPIRRVANSRLFQLGFVVAIVLLLENFSNNHAMLARAADGILPWRGRPAPLKRGLIARVPPIDFQEVDI